MAPEKMGQAPFSASKKKGSGTFSRLRWSRQRFDRCVREAVRGVERGFGRSLDNVTVVVKDRLSPREAKRLGLPSDVLAYYAGQPTSERGLGHGLPAYHGALPDRIVVIQTNLETMCRSDAQLTREIRRTIAHEVAHYVGISDERLEELGLD